METMNFPVTLVLIAITCILSLVCFSNADMRGKMIMWPPAVSEKREYFRFISSGFIHADGSHLLFNMLTLFFFGRNLEPLFVELGLGRTGYLLFYLGGIIVSEIPSYLKHKNDEYYYSLGASGAISAVVFALILFAPWATIYLKFIIPIPFILYGVGYLIYSAYMSRKGGDHINHSAHLWGALFGIAFMAVVTPEVFKSFIEQLQHPHFDIGR